MPSSLAKTDVIVTRKAPDRVRWGRAASPFGPILFGLTNEDALCRMEFMGKRKASAIIIEWQRAWPKTQFVHDKQAVDKMAQKVFGKRIKGGIKAYLVGTVFQQSVWKALLDIPEGKVISYADMAKRINKPKAARAVGNALGANPVPILIPCHRVVASGGRLGGYGGGLTVKRQLLKSENIDVSYG